MTNDIPQRSVTLATCENGHEYPTMPAALTKQCGQCGITKPVTEFYKRSGEQWPRSVCKQCSRAQLSSIPVGSVPWKRKNPAAYSALRRKYRLRQYGITPDEWQALFERQNGACAACRSADPGGRGQWALDHEHNTGRVRGILCNPCNLALGHLRDDPKRILALLVYIQEPSQ